MRPGQSNFVGPGSTAQGDYLRGVGVASFGMGVYNHQTAIANSINADTAIKVNEYIYGCLMNEKRMNAEHREVMAAQDKENYNKIRQRIEQHPEARDVRKGDALNAVLEQLNNPKIQESSSRSVAVPLSVDEVRRIPFKLGPKGVKSFSIARLTAKDKGNGPSHSRTISSIEVDENSRRPSTTPWSNNTRATCNWTPSKPLQKTVDDLEFTVEKVVGKISDTLYLRGEGTPKRDESDSGDAQDPGNRTGTW